LTPLISGRESLGMNTSERERKLVMNTYA